jgi:multidrug efflux pump subunit AcrA (membrane-fusion protein)
MDQNRLFRKAALEKLASPERLDVLMQVTSPLGWLALLTMAVLLGSIVAWSIFGSMAETVYGEGILLGGDGLREIKATGEGVLESLTVNLTESVKEGQVVGSVLSGSGRSSQILAATAGRVIEVNRKIGDRVQAGDTVARIEPPAAQIQAVVFVDAATGTRIAADKQARVSPSTVKREEYGFMIGTVQSVSDVPVTAERFNSIIPNQALFQDLVGQGSKLEMRATLQADSSTPSGFKWSSSTGPPFKVLSGTRVSVSVVVDQTRPISKVLPFVRKTLGTS